MTGKIRKDRGGFTLIELLVVLAITGMLLAMAIPSVLKARNAARRISCSNNLKQIGVALHAFQSAHGFFPPSTVAAKATPREIRQNEAVEPDGDSIDPEEVEVEDHAGQFTEHQSWTASCLPFYEQAALAEAYRFDQPWSNLVNRPIVTTPLAIFQCPTAPNQGRADPYHVRGAVATDYGAIQQVDRQVFIDVFGVRDPGLRARQGTLAEYGATFLCQITDGLSNTLMIAECAGRPDVYVQGALMSADQFTRYTGDEIIEVDGRYIAEDGIGWADPEAAIEVQGVKDRDVEVYGPRMINALNTGEAYSFHSGGAQFLFADGSVHFLTQDVDAWVYVTLCTRAGGEIVNVK